MIKTKVILGVIALSLFTADALLARSPLTMQDNIDVYVRKIRVIDGQCINDTKYCLPDDVGFNLAPPECSRNDIDLRMKTFKEINGVTEPCSYHGSLSSVPPNYPTFPQAPEYTPCKIKVATVCADVSEQVEE